MLKTRIIPILLTDGKGNCVKPIKFQRPYRKVGSLMQYIKNMNMRDVDELIVLDIEASREGRLIDAEKIKQYTKELYCPVTLGGGIKNLDDISLLLNSGADKISLNTALLGANINNSYLVEKATRKFGSQAIVAAIDHVDKYSVKFGDTQINGVFNSKEWSAKYYSKQAEKQGAGEILLTDTFCDGAMEGYNIDLINTVTYELNIPVIANGGCGEPAHMHEALCAGAHAIAVGSMFLYKDHTPKQCAQYLAQKGWATRL